MRLADTKRFLSTWRSVRIFSGFSHCGFQATRRSATTVMAHSWKPAVSAFLKKNWFILSLPPLIFFCQQNPQYLKTNGPLQAQNWKDPLVATIFLMTGLGLSLGHVTSAAAQWKAHTYIQFLCFGVCPLLMAWIVCPLLEKFRLLPDPVIKGLLFASCVPTSIGISLALAKIANGDVALALINSALGNLIGLFLTPYVAQMLTGVRPTIDIPALFANLLTIIFLPSVVGIGLRHFLGRLVFDRFAWAYSHGQSLALWCLLSHVFSNAFAQTSGIGLDSNALASLILTIIGIQSAMMVLGWIGGRFVLRFPRDPLVTSVICGHQKTAAMGIPLVSLMYAGHPDVVLMTLPLIIWHPVQSTYGPIIASMFLRRMKGA